MNATPPAMKMGCGVYSSTNQWIARAKASTSQTTRLTAPSRNWARSFASCRAVDRDNVGHTEGAVHGAAGHRVAVAGPEHPLFVADAKAHLAADDVTRLFVRMGVCGHLGVPGDLKLDDHQRVAATEDPSADAWDRLDFGPVGARLIRHAKRARMTPSSKSR